MALLTAEQIVEDAPGVDTGAAILVVDDNPSKRLAVQTMLSSLGHELVDAGSGREALRAIMRQEFAVILMNVRMPSLDGLSLIHI